MAKDPAFLFYSSDFLTGTISLTNEEKGQYITLLCVMHQSGRMSIERMRSILRGEPLPAVLEKFRTDDKGLYYNNRLEDEAKKRNAYSESRRKNRQKKQEEQMTDNQDKNKICKTHEKDMINISESYVEHMENENENTSSLNNKNRYGEIIEELKSSQIWIESVAIASGYSSNEVKERLDLFGHFLIATGKTGLDKQGLQSYFTNWLKKKEPNVKPGATKSGMVY